MTDFATSLSDARPERWVGDTPASSGLPARKVTIVAICLIVFVLSGYFDVLNDFLGVAILTAALLIGLPEARRSSLAATLAVTGVAIFTMPYLGLVYVDAGVQTAWFALFNVVSIILVHYEEPLSPVVTPIGYSGADLPLIAVYLVVGLLLWGAEGLRQITFYAGWALALIHLERIHAAGGSLFRRVAGLFIFAAVIGYFVTIFWAGSGRIVQLSFALGPILLAAQYRTIRLNAYVLGAAAAGLSFAGRLVRFGWSDGLAGLSVDSGASPITITSYLWVTRDTVLQAGSIVDQWLLFFVNWFPRNLWPSKPLGIGSTFVDMVIGRQGVSAEHNLATGFFGEHIFYLPHAWIISVALLVGVVILLRRGIAKLSAPYRAPVLIYDVWLITLFWGGMASFAARAWFALIPVIPYVLVIRYLDRRRHEASFSKGQTFDVGRDV